MTKHLRREIGIIKKRILALSAMVEESLQNAVRAVQQADIELAETVVENDHKIDNAEIRVEEECLKILALHQPVAVDLRFIVAVLKINNDLERIGDHAVNMAEVITRREIANGSGYAFDLGTIAELSQKMLNQSLDSLVNLDPGLAFEVCKEDDAVDRIYSESKIFIREEIEKNPQSAKSLFAYLSVYHTLERVADLATNIAEDVIYMTEGDIIRHRVKEAYPADTAND